MRRRGNTIGIIKGSGNMNRAVRCAAYAAVAVLCWTFQASAQVIYVDGNAPGVTQDGQSWCTAHLRLQNALSAATPGTEIRVADGVQTPTLPNGSRGISFALRDGVAILGGYAGCGAADPDERDPSVYLSILSGDLNGDDAGAMNKGENSLHVVTGAGVSPSAVLDGFTITGAFANSGNPGDRGGGIFIFPVSGSPTIRRCIIRDNIVAAKGAGMYGFLFEGVLEDCVFKDNEATDGGGLYNLQSNPLVKGCSFEGNTAAATGGGVFNLGGDPVFEDCRFQNNQAIGGGAMNNTSDTHVTLKRCRLTENQALGGGSPSGGGILCQNASVDIHDSIINGNSATVRGGGVHGTLGSTISIRNSVLAFNTAANVGGVGTSGSATSIVSSILWGNGDNTGMPRSAQAGLFSGTLEVDYSILMGWDDVLGGEGNSGDDPMFADADGADNFPGTPDDDFRLAPESPARDSGDPAFAPPLGVTDYDGAPRLVCDRVDMGPFEFEPVGDCPDMGGDGEPPSVPTVSSWGAITLTLLLLVAGKLVFYQSRQHRLN